MGNDNHAGTKADNNSQSKKRYEVNTASQRYQKAVYKTSLTTEILDEYIDNEATNICGEPIERVSLRQMSKMPHIHIGVVKCSGPDN